MTREEISSIPAGSKLNLLVADQITKLPIYSRVGHNFLNDKGICEIIPNYSGDIKYAWEVVEKLGELGYTVFIEWKGAGRGYEFTSEVSVQKSIYTVGHGVGEIAESICKAGLMAVCK